MKLFQKSFFRSFAFRLLLLLCCTVFAFGTVLFGIGTAYNIAIGSYETAERMDFADSPLCEPLVHEQLLGTWHALYAQLQGGSTVIAANTQPPVQAAAASTPTPLPVLTPSPEPFATAEDAPFTTLVPTWTAATEDGTLPAAPMATPMPTPEPVQTAADADAVAMISPTPGVDADVRLVLTEQMRQEILETLCTHLRSMDNKALVFTLYDPQGNILAASDDLAEHLRAQDTWCMTAYLCVDENGCFSYGSHHGATLHEQLAWVRENHNSERTLPVVLSASLRTVLPYDNIFSRLEVLHHNLISSRTALPVLLLACLAAFFIALPLLLSAAGRRTADTAFHRSFFDRIPSELFLVGMGMLFVLTAMLIAEGVDIFLRGTYLIAAIVCILCTTVLILILLLTLLSTAVRMKTGTLWKNSLCALLLRGCLRLLRTILRLARTLTENIRLLWQVLLGTGVYLGFTLLSLLSMEEGLCLLWLLVSIACLLLLCCFAIQLDRLRGGAKRMRAGNLTENIPLKGMFGPCRAHAEDLNSLADGLGTAVEARIKSERMKTDLITNVSHDLKTPLTSIVNYVELLKAEPLENETAKGYIEVLDRQAQRLKKLTTDIVDASKAQSGALQVSLLPTDISELLSQCLAEYEERFAAVPLTPMLHVPQMLMATADGRLLFRVLDNLLGNAAKYAMPHTRLYLDAEETQTHVRITLKNISREALNIPADELTARFVRGDLSRSTEGSGLGLSIAEDLMRLQGGTLQLSIDGDLFRAVLTLPKA